jgi:hypothetical protein
MQLLLSRLVCGTATLHEVAGLSTAASCACILVLLALLLGILAKAQARAATSLTHYGRTSTALFELIPALQHCISSTHLVVFATSSTESTIRAEC